MANHNCIISINLGPGTINPSGPYAVRVRKVGSNTWTEVNIVPPGAGNYMYPDDFPVVFDICALLGVQPGDCIEWQILHIATGCLCEGEECIPEEPSATPTNTPTISITPSITPTTSVTPSITPTTSVTPSITPTISVTPSITPTISVTPSITPTHTPTVTPTTEYESYAVSACCDPSVIEFVEFTTGNLPPNPDSTPPPNSGSFVGALCLSGE